LAEGIFGLFYWADQETGEIHHPAYPGGGQAVQLRLEKIAGWGSYDVALIGLLNIKNK